MPAWLLKLGTVTATAASVAGFWTYVTGHVKPVRAPLHPKTVVEADAEAPAQQVLYLNDEATPSPQTAVSGPAPAGPAPPRRVVVKVVQGAPDAARGQLNVGAAWLANNTGAQPVTNTYVS